jgi:pimeloyl-ACP methyl ester carboxylesterase
MHMSREQKRLDRQIRHLDPEIKKLDGQLSRRTFLLGALAMAEVFVYADQGLADLKWGDRQTEVKVLPEYEDTESDELWVIGPGLGVQSTEGIASTLKTSLETVAPIAYMQISDDGLSINGLATHLERLTHKRQVKKLHLYGHSIGTPTILQIVNQLNLEVGTLLCDGSPYDVTDVRDENLTVALGKLVSHYQPGYVSKLIGEIINSTIRDPNHSLSTLDQLRDALRIADTGIASKAWGSQLSFFANINTSNYAEKITEQTKTAYIKPKVAANDRVVDVLRASPRYDQTFYGSMTTLDVDTGYHACPTDFPGQYNQAIDAYLRKIQMHRNNPRLHKP